MMPPAGRIKKRSIPLLALLSFILFLFLICYVLLSPHKDVAKLPALSAFASENIVQANKDLKGYTQNQLETAYGPAQRSGDGKVDTWKIEGTGTSVSVTYNSLGKVKQVVVSLEKESSDTTP